MAFMFMVMDFAFVQKNIIKNQKVKQTQAELQHIAFEPKDKYQKMIGHMHTHQLSPKS